MGVDRLARLALLLLLAPAAAQAASPYRRGQAIEITGSVADASGAPVEGVTVVLFAAHRGFELRTLRRAEEGHVRVPTSTDARGRFRIVWRWDPYYDTFRIRAEGVAAADAAAGRSHRSVLAETDIGRRVLEGSPVVVTLEVDAVPRPGERSTVAPAARTDRSVDRSTDQRAGADRADHSADRSVDRSVDRSADHSADQKRIFDQMGKPDRVDRLDLVGGEEVAWWYFDRGKSYHFRGGRLEQVVEFEPVESP